jgi:hypothetical protein
MINRKNWTSFGRCGGRICFLVLAVVGLLVLTMPTADAKKHHRHHGKCPKCDFTWPTLEQLQALDESDKYQVLYPYQWTDYEKDTVEQYLADNAALKTRGPIDVEALVNDPDYRANTPGVGPVLDVTEEMVRYQNEKYDPENPIRHDSDYAQDAGYADILAFLSYGAHDDFYMVPWPRAIRDKMLVSDLNHSVTAYEPIHPGDTLYLVADERIIVDITPPQGSTYRSIVIQSKGSIYNQHYQKVSAVVFRVTEGLRIYTDTYAEEVGGHSDPDDFGAWWVAPDWLSRPEHYYTDADWDFIQDVWENEEIRGSTPRYWEDVRIGDQPTWTLDGPIFAGLIPSLEGAPPYGMGLFGSRNIKAEILDEDLFATLFRSPLDGIYYLQPDPDEQIPTMPGYAYPMPPTEGDPGERLRVPPLVNYTTRDFAIRHITNWMGDAGRIRKIGWSIMDPRGHADFEAYVPTSPLSVRYLHRVPHLRCKYVNVHGLQKDIALVKSYVVDKRVRKGKHLVKLVWWVENIEGDIWTEGGATIELPSKYGAGFGHGRRP